MKRKNKFLFSVICLTGLAGVLAISGMSKFNSELLVFASNGTQEWNHYEAVAPTFDSNGSKEYWVSCSDPIHPIQFTAPTGDVEITNACPYQNLKFIEILRSMGCQIDYKNDIIIIDIGHFESEQCTKNIFYRVIQEKFPNFALYYSDIEQNPINYL